MAHQEIRSYDYVNHPYARVRELVVVDPIVIFAVATRATAHRARELASELRATVGGVDVAAEVVISVGAIEDDASGPLEIGRAHV